MGFAEELRVTESDNAANVVNNTRHLCVFIIVAQHVHANLARYLQSLLFHVDKIDLIMIIIFMRCHYQIISDIFKDISHHIKEM